jgi:hypothetical protein
LLAALDVTETDNATLTTVQPVLHAILQQAAEFYAVQNARLTENALVVAAFAVRGGIDDDIAKQMLVYLEDLADEMIDLDLTPQTRAVFEGIQEIIPLETIETSDDGRV